MYFFILFRRHFIQSGGPVRIARYPPRCIFPRAYLSCPVLSSACFVRPHISSPIISRSSLSHFLLLYLYLSTSRSQTSPFCQFELDIPSHLVLSVCPSCQTNLTHLTLPCHYLAPVLLASSLLCPSSFLSLAHASTFSLSPDTPLASPPGSTQNRNRSKSSCWALLLQD